MWCSGSRERRRLNGLEGGGQFIGLPFVVHIQVIADLHVPVNWIQYDIEIGILAVVIEFVVDITDSGRTEETLDSVNDAVVISRIVLYTFKILHCHPLRVQHGAAKLAFDISEFIIKKRLACCAAVEIGFASQGTFGAGVG